MNDIFRRRLIGLAVLLVLVFILSLLLPKGARTPGSDGLPSTTVALDGSAIVTKPLPVQRPAEEPKPDATESVQPSEPIAVPKPAPAAVSSPKSAAPLGDPPALEPKTPAPAPKPTAQPTPPIQTKPVKPPVAKPLPPVVSVPAPAPHLEVAKPAATSATAPAASPVSAPTTKAAAASVPKSAAGTLWYVQMGSFADAGNAQTTVSLLQNIGYRGEIAKIVGSTGATLYRVRLGPFPTEAVARQAFDKVSRQGYPQARVVSEDRSR